MKNTNRLKINEYKNYLIRSKKNSIDINMNIKSLSDIKAYGKEAQNELKKLEELSNEYKLYDSNYEEFRLAMGRFAMGLYKSNKLNISEKNKKELDSLFIKLDDIFEDLLRKNLMKDAYVWK